MRIQPGYVVRVKPADIGSRVTLRMITDSERYRDVVGELISWSGGILRVRRRDGTIADVPEELLVAGKVVPPAPPSRSARRPPARVIGDLELEEIAARGWQGFESEWLGQWLLRASEGFTGRANSVLPLGDPGLPLAAALDRVDQWYASRGLPARFQVPLPARADLDEELAAGGWSTKDRTQVLTAPIEAVLATGSDPADLPDLTVEDEPSAQWLELYHYRGGPPPPLAARQLRQADRPVFVSIRDGERSIAVARGALTPGWLGITAVEVAESARRRGLGGYIVRQLCRWAAVAEPEHAHSVYLQVQGGNEAALALYERLGFARHHDYQYRIAPTRT